MKNRRHSRMHQGLFIDVFIMEGYPNSPTARRLYDWLVYVMTKILKYNYKSYLKSSREVVFRSVVIAVKATNLLLDIIVGKDPEYITHRTWFYKSKTYPRRYFSRTSDVEFEGHKLQMFN